jgi:hypothetical protein
MARSREPQHTLVQPRLVSAFGIIALGVGFGIGLMLARVFVILGYLISIACALLVVWLYFSPLRAAYRTITKRVPYKGPSANELLIAIGMVVLLLIVSSSIFSVMIVDAPATNKAAVQLAGVSQYKVPANSSSSAINIQLHNAGALDAEDIVTLVKGSFRSSQMSSDEIREEIVAMDKAIADVDRKPRAKPQTMRPTQDGIVTLQDIKPNQWTEALTGSLVVPVISVTDAQWAELLEGKHLIYVFFKVRYSDNILRKKGYWQSNFCGYFIGTTSFWHNCDTNQIDLINQPRP